MRELSASYSAEMVEPAHVREALKRLIGNATGTPEEIAEEAGVSRATVYRVIGDGDGLPSGKNMIALVQWAGISLSAFFAQIEGESALSRDGSDRAEPQPNASNSVQPTADTANQQRATLDAIGGLLDIYIDRGVRAALNSTAAARARTAGSADRDSKTG